MEVRRLKPHINRQECFNFIYDMDKTLKNFKEREKDSEKVKMITSKIKNNEFFLTNTFHLTHFEKGNSIHQTSNTGFNLLENQRVDLPIHEITTANAIKPGTIISRNILCISSNRYK